MDGRLSGLRRFSRLEIAAIPEHNPPMIAKAALCRPLSLAALTLALATGVLPALAQMGPGGAAAFTGAPSGGAPGFSPDSPIQNLAPPAGVLAPAPLQPPQFPDAPPQQALPPVPSGQGMLTMAARFGRDQPTITGGLVWRIYDGRAEPNGSFKLIREEKAAAPSLALPPGSYFVHVALGLANTAKPVQVRANEQIRETFDVPAGALRIEGRVGDVKIPENQISFDLYQGSQFDGTDSYDRRPLAQNMSSGDVVPLPEGTYYIVSNYGDGNSVVRSDIRVQTGRLTDITVTHRAAVITLKLVGQSGGEALANTAWSVITPGGDVIKEAIGAFPRFVLAEGEYRALARNEGKMFEHEFRVITGVDGEVEVLAR